MEPTKQQLAQAKKVNVKWRKFRSADEAAFRNQWDDDAAARKTRTLREWVDAMRGQGVEDDANGETFTLVGDEGCLVFRYTRKGDPRLVRTYEVDDDGLMKNEEWVAN